MKGYQTSEFSQVIDPYNLHSLPSCDTSVTGFSNSPQNTYTCHSENTSLEKTHLYRQENVSICSQEENKIVDIKKETINKAITAENESDDCNIDFLDDFLNDPNLFETDENMVLKKEYNEKNECDKSRGVKKEIKNKSDNKKHSKHKFKDKNDKKKHRSKSSNERRSDRNNKSSKEKEKSKRSSEKHSHRSKSSKSSSKSKTKLINKSSSSSPKKTIQQKSPIKESIVNDEEINIDNISEYDSDDPLLTLEECSKIFEEYKPIKKQETKIDKIIEDQVIITKKRIAHKSATTLSKPKCISTPKKSILSPAQIMLQRYQMIKKVNSINNTSNSPAGENPTPRLRKIAPVTNINSLLNAKRKVNEMIKQREAIRKTVAQTAKNRRVAHIPENLDDIPMVLHAEKSKLPINIRSKYLKMLIAECLGMYLNKEAAYERALNEELNCYTRCTILSTYKNSVMLTVNRLRKGETEIVSHKKFKKWDHSEELTGKKFYKNVLRWILNEKELEENGFPLPSLKKGYALFKDGKNVEKLQKNMRRCSRCKSTFYINDNGLPLSPTECLYHPLKKFTQKGETKYACCHMLSTYSGCSSAATHVFDITDKSKLGGFVTTLKPDRIDDTRNFLVAALDCEMIYTTKGTELARVTVVDNKCETIYESLVKPFGEILDYNTRFSGITEEIMKSVSTRITDVQATLLHMFNSKSILIGHSLENDLIALRIIHKTIIDTSVLFPHKFPPKKMSLMKLASDYLQKIIQNSVHGHDSAEDSIACMELVLWKLKEELKTR